MCIKMNIFSRKYLAEELQKRRRQKKTTEYFHWVVLLSEMSDNVSSVWNYVGMTVSLIQVLLYSTNS